MAGVQHGGRSSSGGGHKERGAGAGGALALQLVPNIGANPAGTFYSVVYQLDDGTVKTEFWTVPTTSPTTISAIRTTPGSTPTLSQFATQQYVNTAVAAHDSGVVHLAGSETVTGCRCRGRVTTSGWRI